jgi:flagellar basal body-associated protein FliL
MSTKQQNTEKKQISSLLIIIIIITIAATSLGIMIAAKIFPQVNHEYQFFKEKEIEAIWVKRDGGFDIVLVRFTKPPEEQTLENKFMSMGTFLNNNFKDQHYKRDEMRLRIYKLIGWYGEETKPKKDPNIPMQDISFP